jgi:DsbC/DsbD-like thiol-disulfide interchange protein
METVRPHQMKFLLNIQAQVGWFTCKEICIPQEGIVELKITSGNFIPSKNNEEINNQPLDLNYENNDQDILNEEKDIGKSVKLTNNNKKT